MSAHVYICVCVCACVHAHKHYICMQCLFVSVNAIGFMCAAACLHTHTHTHARMHLHLKVKVSSHLCVYVCRSVHCRLAITIEFIFICRWNKIAHIFFQRFGRQQWMSSSHVLQAHIFSNHSYCVCVRVCVWVRVGAVVLTTSGFTRANTLQDITACPVVVRKCRKVRSKKVVGND